MRRMSLVIALSAGMLAAGCAGGEDAAEAPTGFEPVRVGASGFTDGAPQPLVAGALSVTKTVDGATFFARVEDAGGTDLPEGENARFRLAGVEVPSEEDDGCLAGPSKTHLNGVLRGGQQVRFVLADDADVDAPAGVPVHVWARGIWVNGEVLARGYGHPTGEVEERRANIEAAEAFARDRRTGRWNPTLCPEIAGSPSPTAEDG